MIIQLEDVRKQILGVTESEVVFTYELRTISEKLRKSYCFTHVAHDRKLSVLDALSIISLSV